MPLFHEILPGYEWSAAYSVPVNASPDRVFAAIRETDFSVSRYIRFMFLMRGLPRRRLSVDGFLAAGQCVLADEAPRELTLGLLGRPWQTSGVWRGVTPEEFFAMDDPVAAEPESVRIIWGFRVAPPESAAGFACRLITETRVMPTDDFGRRKFARYWSWIAPFSGLVRKSMLNCIRRTAESPTAE